MISFILMPTNRSRGNLHLLLSISVLAARGSSEGRHVRQGQDKKLVSHSGPSQMRNRKARVTLVGPALLAENEFKVFLKAK